MAFLNEIRNHRVRAIKTLIMAVTWIPHGIGFGLVGPALLDLGLMTSTSFDKISYIFPAKCLAGMVGSMIGKN
jgi:hypothetical protein